MNLLRVETTQQKDNTGRPTVKEQEDAMILNLEMVRQALILLMTKILPSNSGIFVDYIVLTEDYNNILMLPESTSY